MQCGIKIQTPGKGNPCFLVLELTKHSTGGARARGKDLSIATGIVLVSLIEAYCLGRPD